MSDVMPDYHVETQRLLVQVAGLEHNMMKYKLDIMEMESRKANTLKNMAATKTALEKTKAQIDSLIEAHGEPEEVS